jgi:hypothetical protein
MAHSLNQDILTETMIEKRVILVSDGTDRLDSSRLEQINTWNQIQGGVLW